MINPPSISVLLTCFNRRELTLKCVAAAKAATAYPERLRFFVTDDGSTDGTSEAITSAHPDVTLLKGSGQLFWNGGMRNTWEYAQSAVEADFYLWLNDDLELAPGTIDMLLDSYQALAKVDPKVIVVGKVRSLDDAEDTYGGRVRQAGLSRLRFRAAHEGDACCDTMNGNCVLIPARAVDDVGINSPVFRHAMGDIDYGLRARQAGYSIVQTAQPVGRQDRNPHVYARPQEQSWQGLRQFMTHPKGMPVREWLHFCRRHGGWLWPVNFVVMYARPAMALVLRSGR